MANKPLTGHSKLAELAIPRTPTGDAKTPPVVKSRIKNFRLAPADILRLQKLTDTLNGESERPMSETAVIKGLILLGEKTAAAKLLRLIQEVR